ncbi:MAG: peptidase M23 [Sphingobacteriales bacterium]|nr:MAG: peptidase M23 [Sphingobacteriales bacterium]
MKIIKIFLFSFAILLICYNLQAQTRTELERRKAQLNKDIEMINNTLSKTSTNKRVTLKQLNDLRAQIRLREEKINTINSEVRLLNGEISQNVSNVRSLNSQLGQLKTDYAAMILFAQKNQSSYSKLMYVFAASNFNQAYKRLKYLNQFGKYRMKQAGYIETTQQKVKRKISELNQNKNQKDNLLTDQVKEKKTLGNEKNNQEKVVKELTTQEKQLKKDLAQKQRDAQKLDRAIRQVIEREIALARHKAEEEARIAAAKAKAENLAAAAKARAEGREVVAPVAPKAKTTSILASTPEAAKLSASFITNRGRLPWPVANGVITENYGTQKIGGVTKDSKGWTIRTNQGATARSVFDGTVSKILEISGSNIIIIRHGEFFTVYKNLESVSVSVGQKVSTKQTIGTVANTEGSADLDFQLWKGMDDQNPAAWLAN